MKASEDVAVLGLLFVVDEGVMAEDEDAVTVKTEMMWRRKRRLMVLHEFCIDVILGSADSG